jgi:peptidoglycan-associated lipoprotein
MAAPRPGTAGPAPADLPASLSSLDPRTDGRGVVLSLGDRHFLANSTLLRPDSASLLDALAQYVASHPDQPVVCEGYSENSPLGGEAQVFAEGRARSVQTALFERGVALSRVKVAGYGEAAGGASQRVDVILRRPGQAAGA